MFATATESDISRTAAFRARLSHRLAMHLDVAPATLAPSQPLVSFTFDDAPASACTAGAAILGAHGARGTYYVAGGLIGDRNAHWRLADDDTLAALHASGHEIGCHTYSHAFLPDLGVRAIRAEAERNLARLRMVVPDIRPESFAFPFGYTSIRAKYALRRLYRSSRGIAPGLNHGRADLQFLRANPLMDGRLDEAGIARLMDEAASRKAWLIFYTHDVANRPSAYGCSPRLLEAALEAAAARGIACVSVAEGLRRATERAHGNDGFTIARLARRQIGATAAGTPLL